MKVFDKRETTTILAALRYLQAHREDALEAMKDFDDTAGMNTSSDTLTKIKRATIEYLLTEKEIDTLCERINLDGVLTQLKSVMTVYVAFVGSKVKGILTAKQYMADTNPYWDELKPVEVPVEDFNGGKVTVATIKNYL